MSEVPEVGKRYRIHAEFNVVRIHHSCEEEVRVIGDDNRRYRWSPKFADVWEEVEPEFEIGELYIDAEGMVFLHDGSVDGFPWRSVNEVDNDYFTDDYPRRPLERLYRESELNK